MHCCFIATIVCGADLPRSYGEATDRVRLARGSEAGEVTEMTRYEVTLDKGATGSVPIAVNEIRAIVFEGEPAELTQARVNAGNGAFAKAHALLDKIAADQVKRDFVKQDIEFYKAYCASRLALSGEGEITDAGKQLNLFVRNNPDNFHFLEASEMMGDLLMASGRYDFAEKQYAELAKAPWPVYKMRAAVSLGRSLQAQGKHAEAIQQFDAALAMGDDGPDAQNQKLSATLGKAVSLAETAKGDDAVKIIQKVIQDADPQQKELQRGRTTHWEIATKSRSKPRMRCSRFCASTSFTAMCRRHTLRRCPTWFRCGKRLATRSSRARLARRCCSATETASGRSRCSEVVQYSRGASWPAIGPTWSRRYYYARG